MSACICSAGGAGTTMLQGLFDVGEYRQYKHSIMPPEFRNEVAPPVMFVYADLGIALMSMFRRFGYFGLHADRVKRNPYRELDLTQYLENGEDELRIGEQWDNWMNVWRRYPILFVRYEAMWDNKEFISDWLQQPNVKWPKKQNRETKDNLSVRQEEALYKLYGRIVDRMKWMPEIWEKKICLPGTQDLILLQSKIRKEKLEFTERVINGLRGKRIQTI